MDNPIITTTPEEVKIKVKNPKRVAAGKKGVEAKKLKSELKRKEAEQLKKENMELKLASEASGPLKITSNTEKQITMDSEKLTSEASNTKLLFLPIVGLGIYVSYQYFYTPKKEIVKIVKTEELLRNKRKKLIHLN